MPRIAIDAMGGDQAPREIIAGAVAAAKRGHDVVLVGDEPRVRGQLESLGADLPVIHASEVIAMTDDPARAIREKRDASISVAARLVKAGEADGLVSAGSTGAAMAAAVFMIGRVRGVARPAIASWFPSGTLVLDIGANLSVRPENLAQFAVMGAALAHTHYGVAEPTVGLLNIGEEAGKGRPLEREAYQLIEAIPNVDFIGNVEGRDLGAGRANVIVCDGYTGNVLLKTAEGTARMVMNFFKEAVADPVYADALETLAPAMAQLRERLNPEVVGGAHLLGIEGVVVIAHGSSSRVAIVNAIETALKAVNGNVPRLIAEGLSAGGAA